MTSKHLFFKAMREDMRHRTWMVALSALGSFLTMPVAWLILRSNSGFELTKYEMTAERALRYLNDISEFYNEYMVIMAGIIAIAGALIVGLFGFRYVFHKNMVDTWHSLPIKRTTLYGACWLNGYLIWLVPFLIAMVLTALMSCGFALEVTGYTPMISGAGAIGTILKEAGLTFLTMNVVFLLVYNTVLFAVMLSGNILNTLISLGIIGFGVIGIYGLGIVYLSAYMYTFYESAINWENVVYASPLFSVGCLLYARADYASSEAIERMWQLGPCMIINFVIALGVGVGAWYLYQKRSSELAEQGIKNKPLIAAMKLIVGVAGGMCGWLLMQALTSESEIWGVFGCVLVAVLAFGILDIIFHMDFKAFFTHKVQMGVTTLLALLVCFAFSGDWFGYDKYLPDKEDIAYMGIYDSSFANRYFYGGSNGLIPLERMKLSDGDAIYAFLERAIGVTQNTDENGYGYYSESVAVKVTLKNGRSYYRRYQVMNNDKDVFWPLLSSQEYLEHTYLLTEEDINGCFDFRIERYDDYQRMKNDMIDREKVRAIMEAYNQDLMSNPDAVLMGAGRVLAQIDCEIEDSNGDSYSIYLDIYDNMTNTIRALEQEGFGKWVTDIDLEDVDYIRLDLGYYPDINATPEQLIALARDTYGYMREEEQKTDIIYGEALQIVTAEVGGEPYLLIEDKNEIAEILQYCGYTNSYRSSAFGVGKVRISYAKKNGEERSLFLNMGTLPEKYILRFGEIDLSEYGVAEYYYDEYVDTIIYK